MLYRKLHVPVNCFPIFFSIPHSPLSTLLILGKTDVSATVSLISAFITRLSNDCGAYSDLNTTNNNLSNGSVLANFSCMKDNEANLCNGYNYANGRFCFNYRGAKSKITDYVFGDGLGTGGTVAKLSDLVKKDDLNTWENITSDCTLANGISIGTFKVYKNTAQKLIKMNGFLTITSEHKVNTILVRFPSNIKLIEYQYVLAYNANTADSYGVYVTRDNVLQNDTKTIPVMNYFVIPNVTMNFT